MNPTDGERQLYVPYWATETAELLNFVMGKIEDKAFTAILDKIHAAKIKLIQSQKFEGVDEKCPHGREPFAFQSQTTLVSNLSIRK